MSKEVLKAIAKRAACDFGIWLCHFDQGEPEAEQAKENYVKLRAKHDGVVQAWKKEQRSR